MSTSRPDGEAKESSKSTSTVKFTIAGAGTSGNTSKLPADGAVVDHRAANLVKAREELKRKREEDNTEQGGKKARVETQNTLESNAPPTSDNADNTNADDGGSVLDVDTNTGGGPPEKGGDDKVGFYSTLVNYGAPLARFLTGAAIMATLSATATRGSAYIIDKVSGPKEKKIDRTQWMK